MAHTELDLRERRAIEDMLNARVPVSEIAAEIGRHRSTVYREIKRNYFIDGELPYLNGSYGMNAQREASKRRARRRKLVRLEELRAHDRNRIFDVQSLSHRSESVAERTEFGHWECDLMLFRKEHGKVNVTSLVERVSRYAVVMRNEDRQSKPIMEALINGLAPLPADARQSITFDRGTEFSAWRRLKDGIGADSWFCDPQAPWQKGTVENTNNRLRKYLPRSTEPTARKCLGYRTPAEIFETNLMEIQNRLR